MEFQVTWFALWGLLWSLYFVADGFDLGVGIIYPFLGRNDQERRVLINTIGPVWDGNKVWLVTAGGATFAAFPKVYALMFSYLYSPLLIILFALIFRGVAFEFRGKMSGQEWKKGWDVAIFMGSLLPALLFGVAFGNIFQGLPMDKAGYHGSLLGLLSPYGLIAGVVFVLMFTVHGSLWVAMKTESDLSERALRFAFRSWPALLIVFVTFFAYSLLATNLRENYIKTPLLMVLPILAVAACLGIRIFISRKHYMGGFLSSGAAILALMLTGLAGLYPNIIPSSIDPSFSLTIFNSSSSIYTLRILTIVALLFVPLVIFYQLWVYYIFRHKVTKEGIAKDKEAY